MRFALSHFRSARGVSRTGSPPLVEGVVEELTDAPLLRSEGGAIVTVRGFCEPKARCVCVLYEANGVCDCTHGCCVHACGCGCGVSVRGEGTATTPTHPPPRGRHVLQEPPELVQQLLVQLAQVRRHRGLPEGQLGGGQDAQRGVPHHRLAVVAQLADGGGQRLERLLERSLVAAVEARQGPKPEGTSN